MIHFLLKHKFWVFFALLLLTQVFFRFYELFPRAQFEWDQVDSAWAAKSLLVDHHYLLNGPVAKQNTGIYMGPIYFYLISIVYFFTNLDPIASPIFQALLSVGNFCVIFFVTKKLFGTKIAFMAGFITVVSIIMLQFDRVQSAYYLIAPLSYLIFYATYEIIQGKSRFIFLLALLLGLSFHVDFTSVLYLVFIACALPFFPRNKKTVLYILYSLPIVIAFVVPSLLSSIHVKSGGGNSFVNLYNSSYHGIHLARILQLSHDAFISFEQILQYKFLRPFVFLVAPVFMYLYFLKFPKKNTLKLFYLMVIWILVPWAVFATYRGELTDYYFSFSRDIAIVCISYILLFLFQRKSLVIKALPILFLIGYVYTSMGYFFSQHNGNLMEARESVKQSVKNGILIPFVDREAHSYIYYVYTRNAK